MEVAALQVLLSAARQLPGEHERGSSTGASGSSRFRTAQQFRAQQSRTRRDTIRLVDAALATLVATENARTVEPPVIDYLGL